MPLSKKVADSADSSLGFRGVFTLTFLEPDFFAQTFPVGLELLELGFCGAALFVALEDGIDPGMGVAAPGLEAGSDRVWLFAKEADVEHGWEIEGEIFGGQARRGGPQWAGASA